MCPTVGAAVSEAGCQIVVEFKSDSTCGAVVFNTDLCSTASLTSSATSTQAVSASLAGVSGVAQKTGSAPASIITPGPSYKIVYVQHCQSRPNEWLDNRLQLQIR